MLRNNVHVLGCLPACVIVASLSLSGVTGCDSGGAISAADTDDKPMPGGGPAPTMPAECVGDDCPPAISDAGVNAPPADARVMPVSCDAYEYRGTEYNCSLLDVCTEKDFNYRFACASCDPRYGNPPAPGVCPDPDAPDPDAPAPENPDPSPDQPAPNPIENEPVESCMACHNGSQKNDYAGAGLSNPHPFPGAENISCTGCHGGNGAGAGMLGSHVPPPPSIGGPTLGVSDQYLQNDPVAYFNRLTLTGLDKVPEYSYAERPNETFTGIDYLQFINPGDLRVVKEQRGCGAQGCHFNQHAQWVVRSTIATSNGIFSSTRFSVGIENRIPEYRGRDKDGDSLSDSAPRAVDNPGYDPNNRETGEVGKLVEQPELAQFQNGPMYNNPVYDATQLANYVDNNDPLRPNRVLTGSPLETLIDEQVNVTCGDCHLYSAGANNRYADYRSSGCTACHMEYSYDGRSRSGDPNVDPNEPANVDAIAAPERPHVESHQIRNVAKLLPNNAFVRGISDRACVGCHQGSNRTVLQFWGIRLDQNKDLVNNLQYPANPDPNNLATTENDGRLYTGENNTFNGRDFEQHILVEDYDQDGRDDTPPDIHHERGMACIDCHGSRDLHGGVADDATSGKIRSRQDQSTSIACTSCHGTIESYAQRKECTTYDNRQAQCAVDRYGNVLRHVVFDPISNNFTLRSRLDGAPHFVPQTLDTVVNTGKTHPINSRPLYNPKASYAMGRADGNLNTGTGPQQTNYQVRQGFSHTDSMDCASCHASWVNNCTGCHLATEYDANNNNYFFSNITGERILLNQYAADFVYQSPIMMYLGVNSRGHITQISPAEKVFWRYKDLANNTSDVLAFSDRLGEGNNNDRARAGNANAALGALSMNQMAPHSIRGAVTDTDEGPRYCVTCHINEAMDVANNADYQQFIQDYDNSNFANLNFNLLAQEIGQNTGNQNNSPFFVRMVAGLGTGLFLFDDDGCPVNPLDQRANRADANATGVCNNQSPQDRFANSVNNVAYDLDRIVEANGVPNSSGAHPMLPNLPDKGDATRIGSSNPQMAGPLSQPLILKLLDPYGQNNGLVLDSWIDANGDAQGDAANYIQ